MIRVSTQGKLPSKDSTPSTSGKPNHQVELGTRRLNLSIVTIQLWC
ncbi:hypothetical protein VCR14J2_260210 [Vibrio coralliirubri]|nr:hypothetical protein VCR14J2_260210 [Vibrio coralliirubri]